MAQDVTRYGEDNYGQLMLPKLLQELCKIDGLVWIRLLYCYPEIITDELLQVMATQDKIAKYIDIPIQHINDDILKMMNRRSDRKTIIQKLNQVRQLVPGIAIRTTLIAGFPGETEQQFEELAEFVKEFKFERLGCFAYSQEEGTKAAKMQNQIDEQTKQRRAEIIMTEQQTVNHIYNESMIGRSITVLVEGFDRYADCYFGRSEHDAPDIDGKVFFKSDKKHTMGEFITVEITDIIDYDLMGRVKK